MSEWTDADVERVSDALNTITRGGLYDPLGIARALLASGVVVPARVVEEAERERERLREGARAVVVAIDLALDNLRAEYGDVTADRAEESINAHLERAAALLTEGRDRAGEGAAFREGECAPRKCSCMGHVVPGVEHFTPCCDEPHVTAGEGAGL